jgi:transposase
MSETALEIAVLRAALTAAEVRASVAEGALVATKSELSYIQAVVSASEDMIRHLRLQIAKLRREQFGHSAERHARLIEQLEMRLEDIESDIADYKAKAEATSSKMAVVAFERRRPARKPLPEHLPRERVVIEAPTSCTCCGSARIVKMGEDITETLEVIPRQGKVVCYPAGFCVAKAREGRPCGRSSPAGTARRSASRQPRFTPRHGAGRVPICLQ